MKRDQKKTLIIVAIVTVAVLVAILVSGCRTINGLGADLQDVTSAYVERN